MLKERVHRTGTGSPGIPPSLFTSRPLIRREVEEENLVWTFRVCGGGGGLDCSHTSMSTQSALKNSSLTSRPDTGGRG